MANMPIDRPVDNPDAIRVYHLTLECRPSDDGTQLIPVTDPSNQDRVMIRGVIEFQQLDKEGAVTASFRQDLFSVPMTPKRREYFAKGFTEWRDEIANMFLKADTGKELVLENGLHVERPIKRLEKKDGK